jgi:hypothetical protein
LIVACIGVYGERVEQALVGIRRLRPHVDRYVVIVDESVTEEQKRRLRSEGCEVYLHPWRDSTVEMRNQYLQKCQHGDWVVCHDEVTEVLTNQGFKRFGELDGSELILTLNPVTHRLEYQKPTTYHRYHYNGKMIHWKGDCYDICVTPDHKMYVQPSHNDQYPYRFIPAKDLINSKGFIVPCSGIWEGQDAPIVPRIARGTWKEEGYLPTSRVTDVLGRYLADGWSYSQGYRNKIQLSEPDPILRAEIQEVVVNGLGRSLIVGSGRHSDTLTFYHKPFFDYLHKLGKAWEKYIPRDVLNLPRSHLLTLFGSYMKGDGRGERSFLTVSKQLADDIQEVCIKLGWRCVLKEGEPQVGGINSKGKRIIGRRKTYSGSITPHSRIYIRRPPILEDYNGYVYCVTVPNHIILTRRNGKVVFSGNCHDPDEWFNDAFCGDLRRITAEAEEAGIQLLLINSHDVTLKAPTDRAEGVKSDFYKNLIFRYWGDVYYEGVGAAAEDKKAGWHETLKMPPGSKAVKLPDVYWYDHVKTEAEVWERAFRNVYVCGGGNDRRDLNPAWRPLRELCAGLGLETWPKLREYLRGGNVDPRLKEWLWRNRFDGLDYQHEMMEAGRWYFEHLHPEEAAFPDGRVWKPVLELPEGSPAEVMRYVEETYMRVLHRHADQAGKEFYAKAILEGRLKRGDLPEVLKGSREYAAKFGGIPEAEAAPPETVKVQVPVNVEVRLTEGLLVEAMRRSGTWWRLKPRLDVGGFLEAELGEEGWKLLLERFYGKPDAKLRDFLKWLEEAS